MSDIIIEKTPEEIQKESLDAVKAASANAVKDAQEKLAARVTELKTYEGKSFTLKDGTGKFPVKILAYAGIGTKNGVSYHDFRVETKDHVGIVHATEFLENHVEIQVPETATVNEVI